MLLLPLRAVEDPVCASWGPDACEDPPTCSRVGSSCAAESGPR